MRVFQTSCFIAFLWIASYIAKKVFLGRGSKEDNRRLRLTYPVTTVTRNVTHHHEVSSPNYEMPTLLIDASGFINHEVSRFSVDNPARHKYILQLLSHVRDKIHHQQWVLDTSSLETLRKCLKKLIKKVNDCKHFLSEIDHTQLRGHKTCLEYEVTLHFLKKRCFSVLDVLQEIRCSNKFQLREHYRLLEQAAEISDHSKLLYHWKMVELLKEELRLERGEITLNDTELQFACRLNQNPLVIERFVTTVLCNHSQNYTASSEHHGSSPQTQRHSHQSDNNNLRMDIERQALSALDYIRRKRESLNAESYSRSLAFSEEHKDIQNRLRKVDANINQRRLYLNGIHRIAFSATYLLVVVIYLTKISNCQINGGFKNFFSCCTSNALLEICAYVKCGSSSNGILMLEDPRSAGSTRFFGLWQLLNPLASLINPLMSSLQSIVVYEIGSSIDNGVCLIMLLSRCSFSFFVLWISRAIGMQSAGSYISWITLFLAFTDVMERILRGPMWPVIFFTAAHLVCYMISSNIDKVDWDSIRIARWYFMYSLTFLMCPFLVDLVHWAYNQVKDSIFKREFYAI